MDQGTRAPAGEGRRVGGQIVRAGEPSDAAEVARLRWEWRVGEGETPPGSFDDFAADFSAWTSDHAATHLSFVAGAGPGDALVGMAWLALVERVPGPEVWLRRSAFLQSVYVDPAARGAGIGLALVEASVDEARSRQVHYVTVNPTAASVPVYRRAGFEPWPSGLRLTL